MDIAGRIKELRRQKGWSMRSVAAMVGVPYTTYTSYEYGKAEPPLRMMQQLCAVYGISLDELCSFPKDEGPQPEPDGRDETALLERYRKASPAMRQAAMDLLKGPGERS